MDKSFQGTTEDSFYRDLFMQSPDPAVILDLNGYVQDVNLAFGDLCGKISSVCHGKHYSILDLPYLGQIIQNVSDLSSPEKGQLDPVQLMKDGQLVKYEVKAILFDKIQDIPRLYCTFHDITHFNEVEQQLRSAVQKNELLAKAIDCTGVGVLITDPKVSGNPIIYSNQSNVLLTGFGQHELLGKECREFGEAETDSAKAEEIYNAVMHGKSARLEVKNRRKNGEQYWVNLIIDPVYDNTGKLQYFIGIQEDITERKQQQEKLEKDLAMARKVQKSILGAPVLTERIALDGRYLPAQNVGGDLYHWRYVGEGRYILLILDVMGHGISTSLINMLMRAWLDMIFKTNTDPEYVFRELNDKLYHWFFGNALEMQYHCTGMYLVIDLERQVIEYVNAGHPPAILCHKDHSVEYFGATSLPLGIFPEIQIVRKVFKYSAGSQLLLYTDGIFQALNGQSIEQSLELLQRNICQWVSEGKEVLGCLVDQISSPVDDDICLVNCRLF